MILVMLNMSLFRVFFLGGRGVVVVVVVIHVTFNINNNIATFPYYHNLVQKFGEEFQFLLGCKIVVIMGGRHDHTVRMPGISI